LHLHVTRVLDQLLQIDACVGERGGRLARGGGERIVELGRARDAPHALAAAARGRLHQNRIPHARGPARGLGRVGAVHLRPRPPPPRLRDPRAAPGARGAAPFPPGVGAPRGGAPPKPTPASTTARAKAAFSARKPYPGWTASAPAVRAAASSASTDRYDSRAGGGPIATASSAARTCGASRSASEYTATLEKPCPRQARATRTPD